jgi:hypothetical protein
MNTLIRLAAGALVSLAVPAAMAAKVDLLDDCDARDPGWASSGGCTLEDGDVTVAEFNALLSSVNSAAVVGHPSWTIAPTYLSLDLGEKLRVRNHGGRTHSFTEVAAFGGGRVPPFNTGLTPAPECAAAIPIAAGTQVDLNVSTPGLHLFQCCFHPWMRAAIRFTPATS